MSLPTIVQAKPFKASPPKASPQKASPSNALPPLGSNPKSRYWRKPKKTDGSPKKANIQLAQANWVNMRQESFRTEFPTKFKRMGSFEFTTQHVVARSEEGIHTATEQAKRLAKVALGCEVILECQVSRGKDGLFHGVITHPTLVSAAMRNRLPSVRAEIAAMQPILPPIV
jgi:hypothetical protein